MGKENSEQDEVIDKQGSNLYVLVNKDEKTVIGGITKINSKVENVNIKSVRDREEDHNYVEYVGEKERLDLTKNTYGIKKDNEELEEMYAEIENAYLEKERENSQER